MGVVFVPGHLTLMQFLGRRLRSMLLRCFSLATSFLRHDLEVRRSENERWEQHSKRGVFLSSIFLLTTFGG